MKNHIYLIILLSILMSGCSLHQEKPVKILTQEVKDLNLTDKQHIYKMIENEIILYKKMGDKAFYANEYYNAIKYYKIVNFYKGYSYISDKKINHIKKDIHSRSVYHYKRALRSKNPKEKLKELNSVMMCNPNYKKVKILYKKTANKRKNKIFINSLENDLYSKVLNPNHSLKSIKYINKKAKELHKYKYSSEILIRANNLIETEHKHLLQDTIKLYKKGNLTKARKSFLTLSSIYRNNFKEKHYLQKLKSQKQKKIILSKATYALQNREYKIAINYANRVLANSPNNKQAKEILSNATKLAHKKVEKLLKDGKYNYLQKRLKKAKTIFDLALTIDPKNTTALLYKSKIERQLKTITSLE